MSREVPYDPNARLWDDALHMSMRHFDEQGRRRRHNVPSRPSSRHSVAEQTLVREIHRMERSVDLLLHHNRILEVALSRAVSECRRLHAEKE